MTINVPSLETFSKEVRDGALLAQKLNADKEAAKAEVYRLRDLKSAGTDDNRASRIAAIAAGKDVTEPDDLDHLLKIEMNRWRDVEDACELQRGAMRTIRHNAGRQFCSEIAPKHDAIVKRIVDALAVAQEAHLEYYNLQTDLCANEIGYHGICKLQFYDPLGSPKDRSTNLADKFREAIKSGLLTKMPEGLR